MIRIGVFILALALTAQTLNAQTGPVYEHCPELNHSELREAEKVNTEIEGVAIVKIQKLDGSFVFILRPRNGCALSIEGASINVSGLVANGFVPSQALKTRQRHFPILFGGIEALLIEEASASCWYANNTRRTPEGLTKLDVCIDKRLNTLVTQYGNMAVIHSSDSYPSYQFEIAIFRDAILGMGIDYKEAQRQVYFKDFFWGE